MPIRRLYPLILMLALCGLMSNLYGQRYRGYSGQLEFGPSFLSLPAMNQFLATEGYPPMSEIPVGVELSLNRYEGNFVFGVKQNSFTTAQSRFANTFAAFATLNYHYVNFYGGPVIYRKDKDFMLYGTVGLGGGGALLKYQPQGRTYPQNFWTGGFLASGNITASWFVPMPTDPLRLLHMGISLGYIYTFQEQWPSFWCLESFAPDKHISVRPEGFYVRLIFGMGRMIRRY